MEWEPRERILVLGGSRGLGAALVEEIKKTGADVIPISRKTEVKADFSKPDQWIETLQRIRELKPTRMIYCAAGGPYGAFEKFEFKDHQWSWRVSFEFPAALLHHVLQNPMPSLKQVVFIGSSIAENHPDPGAAAYCASKHALRGLITTVQAEAALPFDLRLLSPGYMETDLLPANSTPRHQGKARNPREIAQKMIQSISDPALRMSHRHFD